MYEKTVHMARLNAVFIPIIIFAGSLATSIVLARGGKYALEGILKIGELSAFLACSIGIFEPIHKTIRRRKNKRKNWIERYVLH